MEPEPSLLRYSTPDIPQPIVEPVVFFTFVLASGAKVDVDVKPAQGDTADEFADHWLFTFPRFKGFQKIYKSEIAAEQKRESEIQRPSPEMLAQGRQHGR